VIGLLLRGAVVVAFSLCLACDAPPGTSELWGERGERWDPAGRLPDFSHAGYRAGSEPIPDLPVKASVRDFGAVGDGVTDDSKAFLDALATVDRGAIFVPAGRYVITEPLLIRKSHVVLRGESRDSTVLFFPKTLREVLGRGRDGGPRGWSWGGGWIWLNADLERGDSNDPVWQEGRSLGKVTEPAEKGDTSIALADTSGIEVGDLVRLVQRESDGSLSLFLHAGETLKGKCSISRPGHQLINWVVEVTAVSGDRVHFGRPLRAPVRLEWDAELFEAAPPVEEVGIERLTIEFPLRTYPGHHNEPGSNAISFGAAYNSWVRDVAILNFDNGIHYWYARYCTAEDVVFGGRGGHYALNLGGAQDSVATRFVFETRSVHDTSVANLANGNVLSNGRGIEINFDHHRGASFQNLYSNVDVGSTKRQWRSSHTKSGHYTAAHETFWNVQPIIATEYLPTFPAMNLIGAIEMSVRASPRWWGAWVEPIDGLRPLDLHAAQLARRLGTSVPEPVSMPAPLPEGAGWNSPWAEGETPVEIPTGDLATADQVRDVPLKGTS
jgi:hypothetical protein